jgi:2-polyprenyl-3-methyl-5-hydroxy-6-metoxy-1,4-benzoquinol methylase
MNLMTRSCRAANLRQHMDGLAGTATGTAAQLESRAGGPPARCYLCGDGHIELRFPQRGDAVSTGPEAYRCTSLGHGTHPPIWKCRSCGMVFQWPIRNEDELIEEYQLVEDPTYEAERESRYVTFRKVLEALGPGRGRSLLDVGAYCGYFLDVARAGGYEPEGLELSKWAADRARSLGFEVHGETLPERAAAGRRYQTLTMWDVIEHMADPRAELKAAFTLLEPGGEIYLSTIDIGSLFARGMGRRWPWLMDMHLYYFDRSTISRLLQEVGFRDVAISDYTHYVSVPYLVAKVETMAGVLAPVVKTAGRVVRSNWRIPVNLGDNMLVRAVRPA